MKKIHPKDQTEKLNRAKLEFITRNEKELQKVKELYEKNEKKREEFINNLTSIRGTQSKEIKDRWDFLLREQFFDKEFEDKIKEITIPPATKSAYPFEWFAAENAHHDVIPGKLDVFHMSRNALNEKYLDYLCQHAREIFTELTNGEPSSYLLVGIDLRRSKDVIIGEFENLPMIANLKQIKSLTTKIPEKRLKWLSICDELLEVWDAWAGYGQRRCFGLIAKKLKLPESTVKARWRLVYRLIHQEDYSKEVAAKTADELCAKCKDIGKCYKTIDEQMDFYPCAAFLKLTGKSYTREKLLKDFEHIADKYAYEEFQD